MNSYLRYKLVINHPVKCYVLHILIINPVLLKIVPTLIQQKICLLNILGGIMIYLTALRKGLLRQVDLNLLPSKIIDHLPIGHCRLLLMARKKILHMFLFKINLPLIHPLLHLPMVMYMMLTLTHMTPIPIFDVLGVRLISFPLHLYMILVFYLHILYFIP